MKIAILQFSTTNVPYLKYSEEINRKYCESKNYDYIIEKNDEKINRLIEDRSPTWGKPKIILEHLDNYDYILFMDIDAIVCNFEINIEDFIDENYDLVAAKDDSHHSLMNAGVLLVKNSEWSKKFMEEWWDSGAYLLGGDGTNLIIQEHDLTRKGYFKDRLWHDQTCLTYLYKNTDYKDKIKIITNTSLNWPVYKDQNCKNFIFHAFCYGNYKYRTLNTSYYDIFNLKPNFENKSLSEIVDEFDTDKETEHQFISNHYQEILTPFKYKAKKICEIGVDQGGSLKLWEAFFPNAKIIGLDANEYSFKEERIETKVIDASNQEEVAKFCSENKGFDIIIDDCTHRMKDQQMGLAEFFKSLNPGGVYILEDLHTSLELRLEDKRKFQWGDPSKISTLDFLKNYIKNKKIKTDYISKEDAEYLENNIESCEILYHPENKNWSITSVIRKKKLEKTEKAKSQKTTNLIKNNNSPKNTNEHTTIKEKVKAKINSIIKQKYKGRK